MLTPNPRTALSLATPLSTRGGPRFDPDQDLIENLTDTPDEPAPAPKPKPTKQPAPKPQPGAGVDPDAKAKDLAKKVFSEDPIVSAAALKELAGLADMSEADLAKMMDVPEPKPEEKPEPGAGVEEEEVSQGDQALEETRRMQMEMHADRLEMGVDKVMASKEVKDLEAAYKRLHGDDAKPAEWRKALQARLGDAVVQRFKLASYSGTRITSSTLDKIVDGARKSVVGGVRQTIGDPTGIGRVESAQSDLPGSDIPDEATHLPTAEEIAKDPGNALEAAKAANAALIAKKLAGLRAGDRTSA